MFAGVIYARNGGIVHNLLEVKATIEDEES